MPPQRKTKKRNIPLGVVTSFVALALIVATLGLSYVGMTTKIQRRGSQIGQLEHELGALKMQSDVVDVQIEKLSSRAALRQKLDAGIVKMIPIAETAIVRINPNLIHPANGALRVVSNQTIGQ